MSDRLPVFAEVLRRDRRSVVLWGAGLAAISAMYLSFYPSMGGDTMTDLIAELPDPMVAALGYDQIGTAAGWLSGTVYGLIGPMLLLVFAITAGARLIAGVEQDGTLELEITSPFSRTRILCERLLALVASLLGLVLVVTATSYVLITVLDMNVGLANLLAGSGGLFMLVSGLGIAAFALGAATGSQAVARGGGGALAVLSFAVDAVAAATTTEWMSALTPFAWYLGGDPLINGFDWAGLSKLAALTLVAAGAALVGFRRRDLRV